MIFCITRDRDTMVTSALKWYFIYTKSVIMVNVNMYKIDNDDKYECNGSHSILEIF